MEIVVNGVMDSTRQEKGEACGTLTWIELLPSLQALLQVILGDVSVGRK